MRKKLGMLIWKISAILIGIAGIIIFCFSLIKGAVLSCVMSIIALILLIPAILYFGKKNQEEIGD